MSALDILNEQIALIPSTIWPGLKNILNTNDEADRDEFVSLIRQELSHETFIEMAIMYYEWNMEDEALLMLDLAPDHPMVQIWQAWLLDRAGYEAEADGKAHAGS